MKYRLHVVGLPCTVTTRAQNACAFTHQALNFCKAMSRRGHHVIHYGTEGSDPECAEGVNVLSEEHRQGLFGSFDPSSHFDAKWDQFSLGWLRFNSAAILELKRRIHPKDFVCLVGGSSQKMIFDYMPKEVAVVEFSVGYEHSFAPYRAFHSYAQLHKYPRQPEGDGSSYDVVIPPYFDLADYLFEAKQGTYFAYLGRLIPRKGLQIAIEVCKHIGAKLIVAGTGKAQFTPGELVVADGEQTFAFRGPFEFVGYADAEKRAQLLGGAAGVFYPTQYFEPGGCVAIEAQLCGTPAITSDWGCFPETVEHGRSGYRCRTFEQYVWAARNVGRLDRLAVRDRAVRLYSMDRAATMYEEWFQSIYDIWDKGWMTAREEREQLDWLKE